MKHAIHTLETELMYIEQGLKDWRSAEYEDIRKRQEKKVIELKKAIEILKAV